MTSISTAPNGKLKEIVLLPGVPKKVLLPNGLGVSMVMEIVAGKPALVILAGSHFGLERDFIIASGGNHLPVSGRGQVHIRAGLERVATFEVAVASEEQIRLAS